MIRILLALLLFTIIAIGSCIILREPDQPVSTTTGGHIVVCGRRYPTGVDVVRWDELGGYNAYLEHAWRDTDTPLPTHPANGCDMPRRYDVRPCLLDEQNQPRTLSQRKTRKIIEETVNLIVIHYDASGTSRRCFETLQNERGLSAHFLIDVDGTIYQTLDVKERARHAGPANDRSVGIEIANVGAYEDPETLYAKQQRLDDNYGVRNPQRAISQSEEPFTGQIQNRFVYQFDFTNAQYESLIALTRALRRALPAIRANVPTDDSGNVTTLALSAKKRISFSGIVAHYHVAPHKIDPGPAFNWPRFIQAFESSTD